MAHGCISEAKAGLHSIAKPLFLLGLKAPQFSKMSNRINDSYQTTNLRVGRSNRSGSTTSFSNNKHLLAPLRVILCVGTDS